MLGKVLELQGRLVESSPEVGGIAEDNNYHTRSPRQPYREQRPRKYIYYLIRCWTDERSPLVLTESSSFYADTIAYTMATTAQLVRVLNDLQLVHGARYGFIPDEYAPMKVSRRLASEFSSLVLALNRRGIPLEMLWAPEDRGGILTRLMRQQRSYSNIRTRHLRIQVVQRALSEICENPLMADADAPHAGVPRPHDYWLLLAIVVAAAAGRQAWQAGGIEVMTSYIQSSYEISVRFVRYLLPV
ncbi:hypothetical protein DL769_010233 [Monosporascus sp. CRB-8-3]|nr:hypothetical protein DL769_010233 [Monosporascus sp. CRB-8-3]